jgi:hypothetical protein
MIAQLRVLDPSASAEIGTPERKIIDTVGQALADAQIDLDALGAALDLDSKYGTNLDRFLSIFGFARQKATFAAGYVTFSRVTASNVDIRIPINQSLKAPGVSDISGDYADVLFQTTYETILPAGDVSVIVPVRAVIAGASGNVATGRITEFTGNPLYGITAVFNDNPITGGKDVETDEEYKVRFKNTVFRNLAGTEDQYLALATATAYTTRANVIGPQSFFREYVQIPPVDDATARDVGGFGGSEAGGGNAGEYSTALSTIPYAKYFYATEQPVFVAKKDIAFSDGIFYRQDVDFRFNTSTTDRDRGDAHRLALAGLTDAVANTIQPSVTFFNVYTGANGDVQAVRPDDVVLLEYSYMSEASRNDITRNITNAVDVYIDGSNDTLASTVITRPTTATAFVDNIASKWHYENYRRIGQPEKRPIIGNVATPLYWEPVTDLPDQIVIEDDTYYKGIHYWAIEDVSLIGGTVRARSGVEWSTKIRGRASINPLGDPDTYTGKLIQDNTGDPVGGETVEVDGYVFDKNIVDLQAALVGSKQITTDVLAHRAKRRYFKLDITVMYAQGVSQSETNNQIRSAVDAFLRNQQFGSVIQLSDILQIVHNVPSVDNVRWTTDVPNSPDLARVYECDINGDPLIDVSTDVIQPGTSGLITESYTGDGTVTQPEIQGLYITGDPAAGPSGSYFTLSYNNTVSTPLAGNAAAADIQAALRTITGDAGLIVTEDVRTTVARVPMRSFRIAFSTNGNKQPIVTSGGSYLSGGDYVINTDFFLRDDEQAALAEYTFTPYAGTADTVAGAIIRPRAQNTWIRS